MKLPSEFTHRTPAYEDAETVVDFINICAIADIGKGNEILEQLLSYWYPLDHPRTEPPLGKHAMVYAPEGTLAAFLTMDLSEDNCYGDYHIHIAPDYRTADLYDALIATADEWAQSWVQELHAQNVDVIKVENETWTWEEDELYQARLKAAGYTFQRAHRRMEVAMDAPPPAPRWAEGITLRSYRPGEDDCAIHAAWQEAMADDVTQDLIGYEDFMYYKIQREKDFDPALWFFAMDGDEIAGFILSRLERPGDPETGHIRDVGVRPAWRRKGIANALLQACFGEFYRRGKYRVSLGVDALNINNAFIVYEKAGMHAVLATNTYTKSIHA